MVSSIYKQDDLGAFGNQFLTISLKEGSLDPESIVSKAAIKIGNLATMYFQYPVFPLRISLNSAQTAQLQQQNTVYMAVWDEQGRKATCKGCVSFVAKNPVV